MEDNDSNYTAGVQLDSSHNVNFESRDFLNALGNNQLAWDKTTSQ